ncbi:hypothetical protein K491DRAFT_367611 [Lophiostoma macrostomum CBS 122681]|uniref:ATP-dependent DNA helicase n=1 Tax=Lophiostoma macrostomum CBS 122681 TaxID=1314788 RepID=A0A6A6TAA6_9PLEO|nr:hypothetical protein K491DRAFT_367611 [Lophiostoma macrostomum CBS 122681]
MAHPPPTPAQDAYFSSASDDEAFYYASDLSQDHATSSNSSQDNLVYPTPPTRNLSQGQDPPNAKMQSSKRKRHETHEVCNKMRKSLSPSPSPFTRHTAQSSILGDHSNLQHIGSDLVQQPGPMSGTQSCPLDIDSSPSPTGMKHTQDLPTVFEDREPEYPRPTTSQYYDSNVRHDVPPPDTSLTEPKDPTEPPLCQEQEHLVNLIMSGRNVFYTGSAGCGKSTVLKEFVKRFRAAGKCVRITAPTGRAANDIDGTTTWTFAGWNPASHKKPLEKLRDEAHGTLVWKRMNETDVLVIDEISMVENHHFERLNQLMQAARNTNAAFGMWTQGTTSMSSGSSFLRRQVVSNTDSLLRHRYTLSMTIENMR